MRRPIRVCVESTLEQIVPPILDPAVNNPWTEIPNGAASSPRGLKPFLEVALTFVLIGWINQPCLKRAAELLERHQLLEGIQVSMIATLESCECLPVIK